MSDEFQDVQASVEAIRDGVLHVWDTFGWTQHALGNDEDGYCAMGAWYKASGTSPQLYDMDPLTTIFRKCFEAAVHELTGEKCSGVEAYNDHVTTSPEDVRLVTKHAFEYMAKAMSHLNPRLIPLPQPQSDQE